MKDVFFSQRPGLKLLWYTSVPVYLCCLGRQWMHLLPVVCQTKDLEITAPRRSLCQWWRAHWDVSPEQEIDIFLNCVMQDWLLYMNTLYLCCWTAKANQWRWQTPSKVTYHRWDSKTIFWDKVTVLSDWNSWFQKHVLDNWTHGGNR